MEKKTKRIALGIILTVIITFSSIGVFTILFFWNNYSIPLDAQESVNSVDPDYIFDTGDLTESGQTEEYKAYNEWTTSLEGKVFAVQGGHDREHRRGDPYGTGFFTECNFDSPTGVLKMGNNVFILISEDRYYHQEENIWMHHITDQLHQWISEKLAEYAVNDTNIFIFEHCPIKNTVAWSDGEWWATGNDPWEKVSNRWLDLMGEYDDHIVAHVSGHIHTHYAWKDTPNDTEKYGYGDGDDGIEDVGHFVNGSDKEGLPKVYFLNPQALCYTHGSAWTEFETAAIYYYDMEQNKDQFTIKTRDIHTKKDVDSYTVKTNFPIDLGDGQINFIESKTTIVSKSETKIGKEDWLLVSKGSIVTFHKKWNLPVDNFSIEFDPEDVHYTIESIEEGDNEVFMEIKFEEQAIIRDVNILPFKKNTTENNASIENKRMVFLTDIHFDSPKNGHQFGGVQVDVLAHFGIIGKFLEKQSPIVFIIVGSFTVLLLLAVGVYIWQKKKK
ncbi:MAG: metallophosphoesterase [Promethearchaeia archaeon]